MKLWYDPYTESCSWSESQPSAHHLEAETMLEDDLPPEMPDDAYSAWHDMSVVHDGVRMGPVICMVPLHPSSAMFAEVKARES